MLTTLKNGAEVIKTRRMPDDTFIVLAYWDRSVMPWVTWRCDASGEAFWGHYFDNEPDADLDFITRIP